MDDCNVDCCVILSLLLHQSHIIDPYYRCDLLLLILTSHIVALALYRSSNGTIGNDLRELQFGMGIIIGWIQI